MTDFVFMVTEKSHMFITGPDVVKTVTGEEVTLEDLGGARSHSTKSGVATFVGQTEEEVLDEVRFLVGHLPANNLDEPPRIDATDDPERLTPELRDIMPDSPNLPYDMRKVIQAVVDDGEFMEYHAHWAQSIVCGFARLNGGTVGVVGNQPMVLAGVLDIESSSKAARFVRTCDAFNIPLLTFVDVPGFLPGVDQEHGGIIRHGAKLLYAYCEATVPRIQIITRKAYGGAYVVMDSKSVGSDLSFAWPGAELAVMGPAGGGGDHPPPRTSIGRRSRGPPSRAGGRLHRALRQPLHRRRAGLHRRRDRPGRHPAPGHRRFRDAAIQTRGSASPKARGYPALGMSIIQISPQPTDAEVAAILVAHEALWPRPTVDGPPAPAAPRWRFSGRWWTAPAVNRPPTANPETMTADPARHRTPEELEAALDQIRQAPTSHGTLELIVRRPAVDQREVLESGVLSLDEGLVGDTWNQRGSSKTPDGGPLPRRPTQHNERPSRRGQCWSNRALAPCGRPALHRPRHQPGNLARRHPPDHRRSGHRGHRRAPHRLRQVLRTFRP